MAPKDSFVGFAWYLRQKMKREPQTKLWLDREYESILLIYFFRDLIHFCWVLQVLRGNVGIYVA